MKNLMSKGGKTVHAAYGDTRNPKCSPAGMLRGRGVLKAVRFLQTSHEVTCTKCLKG